MFPRHYRPECACYVRPTVKNDEQLECEAKNRINKQTVNSNKEFTREPHQSSTLSSKDVIYSKLKGVKWIIECAWFRAFRSHKHGWEVVVVWLGLWSDPCSHNKPTIRTNDRPPSKVYLHGGHHTSDCGAPSESKRFIQPNHANIPV